LAIFIQTQSIPLKTFRTFIAFTHSLLTFIGLGFLALAILGQMAPPVNYILSIIVLVAAFLAARSVFTMMQRRGVMSVLASNSASPDADDFQSLEENGIYKMHPRDLASHFSKAEFYLGECAISIWGDWEGRKLKEKNELISVSYSEVKNRLTFQFEGKKTLSIRNASDILLCETYLKIPRATEALWQYLVGMELFNQYSYLHSGNKIKTKSNTKWKPHKYDIGPGMNAIYLQGRFNLKVNA
jgi:hypothetical protein